MHNCHQVFQSFFTSGLAAGQFLFDGCTIHQYVVVVASLSTESTNCVLAKISSLVLANWSIFAYWRKGLSLHFGQNGNHCKLSNIVICAYWEKPLPVCTAYRGRGGGGGGEKRKQIKARCHISIFKTSLT